MGTLTNLNGTVQTQIPEDIARDSEVAAAITAHNIADWVHIEYLWRVFLPRDRTGHGVGYITDTEVASLIANHTAAVDPHPIYLTQPEGDGRYRQTATPLVDGDIPATIARDAEFVDADLVHTNLADPHPNLWTRIANAFLALTGGQVIMKNNPAMSPVSFSASQNSLEIRTTNGSNPILGFHRSGFSATALYHLGYGNNSLRIRNGDGFDGALLHDGNIGIKTAGAAQAIITDNGTTVLKHRILTGTLRSDGGFGTQVSLGNISTANVVGLSAIVNVFPSLQLRVTPGQHSAQPGCAFDCLLNGGAIQLNTTANNSASLAGKPFTVLVTYLG